jgi:hypothetical protein
MTNSVIKSTAKKSKIKNQKSLINNQKSIEIPTE